MTSSPPLPVLRQLLNEATDLPWALHPDVPDEVLGAFKPGSGEGDYPAWEGIDVALARTPLPGTIGGDSDAEFANAALIVAAVNHLPALLDLVERQAAAIEAVQELADSYERQAQRYRDAANDPGRTIGQIWDGKQQAFDLAGQAMRIHAALSGNTPTTEENPR